MVSLNQLMGMMDDASGETLVSMSRKNCHVNGLHSIVLSSDGGNLVRFYITSPDHKLFQNSHDGLFDLSLGIHSHKYNIVLVGLSGFDYASNLIYTEDNFGSEVKKYDYSVEGGAVYSCLSKLSLDGYKRIDVEVMLASTLHTVHVPEGVVACWVVEEWNRAESEHTELFTNSNLEFVKYENFGTADEIRTFVRDLLGV